MAHYVKLFGSIIHSTLWQEESHIKVVWVTMLALADSQGEVQASIPGLAKASGVSIQQCEEALKKFLSPDPYSRSKEADGRRIEVIAGGWELINYIKYRKLKSAEQETETATERKRRQRERERAVGVTNSVTGVTESHAMSPHIEEEEEEKKTTLPTPTPSAPVATRKKRGEAKREKLAGINQEVVDMVAGLMKIWPKTRKDGVHVVSNDGDACVNVERILASFDGFTLADLEASARDWVDTNPEWPNGIHFYFGPGKGDIVPPWKREMKIYLTNKEFA